MEEHERIHSDEKTFSCPHCVVKSSVEEHEIIHSGGKNHSIVHIVKIISKMKGAWKIMKEYTVLRNHSVAHTVVIRSKTKRSLEEHE